MYNLSLRRLPLLILLLTLLASPLPARAAEVIPPRPDPSYIVDQSGKLTPPVIAEIDAQLQQFERATSNQIVVAIYPKMQSEDAIAAYAVRVFNTWKIGQKSRNNGVLLLVFIDDRKLNITTGSGLEGTLPDATCKTIIEQEIKPHFKTNDYAGGIRAGVAAIMAATKGEYKGTGRTNWQPYLPYIIWTIVILFIIASVIFQSYRGTIYNNRGNSLWWALLWMMASSGSSSGSSSSGGWSSGGGGGFSGGGGSSSGGGASGSW